MNRLASVYMQSPVKPLPRVERPSQWHRRAAR